MDTSDSRLPPQDQLMNLVEQMPAIFYTTDRELRFTSSMGAGLVALNLRPGQAVGLSLYDYFGTTDPTYRPIAAHRDALGGQSAAIESTWLGRTFHNSIEPLRSNGDIVGTIGVALDVTRQKQAEEHARQARETLAQRIREHASEVEEINQRLRGEIAERQQVEAALRKSERHFREAAEFNRRLLLELDHRVRNNLAGLISLVDLMRHRTDSVDAFADAMQARLQAMVHVHRMLSEHGWQPVDLDHLVRSLLELIQSMSRHQVPIQIDGPPVHIASHQTLPLTMAILEWATNSTKYGAHSAPTGRLTVRWEVAQLPAGPHVRLHWTEQGGPPVRQPVTASLGTELIRGFVVNELRGRCTLTFPPGGVEHTMEFPVQG